MAFPPASAGPSVGPAPPVPPKSKPLAQVSAMGAAVAPAGTTPMGPASNAPQPQAPAAPAPPPPPAAPAPPIGVAARPAVAPHAAVKSVGTHASASPKKRFNAPHGMVQGAGPAPARSVPPQFGKKAPPFGK